MVAVLTSVVSLAQYGTTQVPQKQDTTKAVSLTGKISDDGKTFVNAKDNKSWTVSNPEALKGHEGHEVTVKAHLEAAKNEIHVISVTMGKGEMKDTTKKDNMK